MQSNILSDKLQLTPETSSVVATAKHPVQSAHVTAPASSVLDQEVIWGGLSPTSFKTYSKNTSSPINRNDGLYITTKRCAPLPSVVCKLSLKLLCAW